MAIPLAMVLASSLSPCSSPSIASSTPPAVASRPQPHPQPQPHHESSLNPQSASAPAHPYSVGSRLVHGIEELRSALTRHSVAAPSSSPPSSQAVAGGIGSNNNTNWNNNNKQQHPPSSNYQQPTVISSASASWHSSTLPDPPPPPRSPVNPAPIRVANANNPSFPMSKTNINPADQLNSNNKNNETKTTTPTTRPSSDPAPDADESQAKRFRPAKPPVRVLPSNYEDADPRSIVVLISSMLMELIQFNDKIPLNQSRLTRFHSRTPPRISVHDYLQRITTHAALSPPLLLSMVYYIDRLCALYPAFTVSSLTIHRFLIASATVASKGLSDSFWTNKTYARIGGVSLAELSLLELEFLFRVEWMIVPQPEVLVDYYRNLVERCDGYEIQDIGAVDDGVK